MPAKRSIFDFCCKKFIGAVWKILWATLIVDNKPDLNEQMTSPKIFVANCLLRRRSQYVMV